MKELLHRINKGPSIVFYTILSFVVLSFLLFLLIDVFNVFGVKYLMIKNLDIPYFWYHWYDMPFEVPLQWYVLGITFMIYAINAGIALERKSKEVYTFWLIMSVGLLLMLVEDAGDVRHAIRNKIDGGGSYGILSSIFELFYFSVIGFILIYAFLKYRNVFWEIRDVRKYLIIGYLLYAFGVSLSFIGSAFSSFLGFSLYEKIGQCIFPWLMVRDDVSVLIYEQALYHNELIEFKFLDMLPEESLELIGAGGLLTAGVHFFVYYRSKGN